MSNYEAKWGNLGMNELMPCYVEQKPFEELTRVDQCVNETVAKGGQ